MEETWKEILESDGYLISSLGRVKRIKTGKILKTRLLNGYVELGLSFDGKQKRKLVHSMVAEAFICKRPEGYEVNHKDSNRSNNVHSNLEWLTPKENMAHAIKYGFRKLIGEENYNSKLNNESVLAMRMDFMNGLNRHQLAKKYNVGYEHVRRIIAREKWSHV